MKTNIIYNFFKMCNGSGTGAYTFFIITYVTAVPRSGT